MSKKAPKHEHVVFSPNLRAEDAVANYWLRQATVRLRREIAWLWQERGLGEPAGGEQLPPFADRASAALDLTRHWAEKQSFFERDPAARYLTGLLAEKPPAPKKTRRGSFGWVVGELALDEPAVFALALALAAVFDANVGSVIAACLNDAARIHPNLMLVQKLWDRPEEVLPLADPQHALFAYGLLSSPTAARRFYADAFWEQPLVAPALVARRLLSGEEIKTAAAPPLAVDRKGRPELPEAARLVAYRLKSERAEKLRVVPVLAPRGAAREETVAAIAQLGRRAVLDYADETTLVENEGFLNSLAALCWLQDMDLFVRTEIFSEATNRPSNHGLPLATLPVNLFLSISDPKQIEHIEDRLLLPTVKIPPLGYAERVAVWRAEFGRDAARHGEIISEVARRFRYEKETIREICRELKALPGKLAEEDFLAACRAQLKLNIGELATEVAPRFEAENLILPPPQARQFEEYLAAMRALTRVHYEWGTAGAWNEGGITILFAGPSGTGKTMAAEIMARELRLPMYRIDLSQVVNKYIGETEKNLKRIFDAADVSDLLLFFDEADALFGKRTEVNRSNDRFANQEISYLLERMERFKGLAILATNRRNDLDEAFMRRLRYTFEFALPEPPERRKIWEQVIPAAADASELDFGFLARQFPLSGGNIRSIVFNACLQSAKKDNEGRRLSMKDVIVAVKREYDKMNRTLSLEQFGAYAKDIAALETR